MKLSKLQLRADNFMFIGIALILGLVTVYCGDVIQPTPLPPTVNQTVSQIVQINPVPSPSPSPNCTPTQVNVVNTTGLASIPANNPTILAANPTYENAVCTTQSVVWGVAPSGACTFSNQQGTEVTVRCPTAGRVTISATVNGKTGSSEFVVG